MTSNPKLYSYVIRSNLLLKLIEYDITKLEQIANESDVIHIISRIRAGKTTSKQTETERFSDVNPHLLQHLNTNMNHVIHDVAVSNGITSFELTEFLIDAGFTFVMDISDKYSVYHYKPGIIKLIYNADYSLCKGYFMFIVADRYINKFYILSHILFNALAKLKISSNLLPFSLISIPDNISNIVRQINYDAFLTQLPNKYTFVRCMNLLNFSYFSESDILLAIDNIYLSLVNEGVFQIGRTTDTGLNDVSFYKKSLNSFIHLGSINNGSEIHDLIIKYSK